MFADLAGFTSFSEGRSPGEVIDMVNAYWERAVPMVVEEGGFIKHSLETRSSSCSTLVEDQPDHPLRACRAGARGARRDGAGGRGSSWVAAVPDRREHRPGRGRQRGSGSSSGASPRSGNTTNVAARLRGGGEPGSGASPGPPPWRRCLEARSLARAGRVALSLKGQSDAVEAFELM